MALPVPRTLSPSKVAAFTDCALAFRFSAIEHLPEAPSVAATRGTLVHAALERLFCRPPEERVPAAADACLAEALASLRDDPELVALGLDEEGEAAFVAEAGDLLARYFRIEDPRTVRPIGLELRLEAEVGGVRLRGVIDRLELDEDGELVVTDYKTGAVPGVRQEQARLGGVHFYALLCEEFFGRRPSRVQLLYLREPVAIIARPSAQSTKGWRGKVAAVWRAVERACATEDFRPRPSHVCEWCSFRTWCPAWGGDPAAARAELLAGQPPLPLTTTTTPAEPAAAGAAVPVPAAMPVPVAVAGRAAVPVPVPAAVAGPAGPGVSAPAPAPVPVAGPAVPRDAAPLPAAMPVQVAVAGPAVPGDTAPVPAGERALTRT